MLFLELAAQSVRGFSPSVRLALKPGYAALKSPADVPAPLTGLLVALAYPDGRGGDAAFLAPGAKAGRAGLTIQAHDGSVWRIARDLGGAGGLHQLNRTTKQFDPVTQDAAEMAQLLRNSVGFPARATWEQLFCLTGAQLPSRRPKAPAAGPAGGKAGGPRVQSAWASMDAGPAPEAGDAPGRLAALEAELKAAREAAELQFRLDGLAADLYKLEARSKDYEELKARYLEARKDLDAAPSADKLGMPADIVERAKRYPEEKKRHQAAMAKLFEEREAAQAHERSAYRPPALYKSREFVGLLVGGLALLMVPALVPTLPPYLALLSIIPTTLAALQALRYIEELQKGSKQGSVVSVFEQREKKLKDEFLLQSSIVQTAFEKVDAITLDDFLAAFARRAQLEPVVAQLHMELAALESDPAGVPSAEAVEKVKAEHEAVNQQLSSMSGGYVREVREIERDLARLREPPAARRATPSGEFAAVTADGPETRDDPTPPLLLLGTSLFGVDVPTLWSVLRDRSVQYLTALTDRRYHGIDCDKDGRATVQAPGRAIPAGELPARDLDVLYLSLRLTLVEKYAAQGKVPLIIEDTFNTVLDAAKQPLFGRMVKHLGTVTQVLHVSGAGQTASLADTPVAI